MAVAPLIIAGVGTAISAYGQWKAGKAAKQAGEAGQRVAEEEAKLQEYNANIADLQAADAIQRGAEEESRFRRGVEGVIGAQRTAFASNNVDVGYGSAVDVQTDAAMLGELDALTIRTNAAREAWGMKVAAVDYRARADIARKEGVNLAATGRAQQTAARIGAIGSVAASTGSLLQQHYGFKNK